MIEYYIINPTGNITALVIDKGIAPENRTVISDIIMREMPRVEQVGFVSFKDGGIRLNMAGGEFCGNATMSAAALYCHMSSSRRFEGDIAVSGAKDKIKTTAEIKNGEYACSIEVQRPTDIKNVIYTVDNTQYTLPTVVFDGITHVIAPDDFGTQTATRLLHKYTKEQNLPAMGVMLYGKATEKLTPIVYVKECDTCIFENSCASGSCAVCAYLTENEDILKSMSFVGPGGTLRAESVAKADYIKLYGNARIEKHCQKEI